MSPIKTFPHAQLAAFLTERDAPTDLSCAIGWNLLRDPVRIQGDTTDTVYEAAAARRTLGAKFANPFTRAPVVIHPPLVRDVQRQNDVKQFRAAALGYAKVAAHLQETGQPWPDGTPVTPVGNDPTSPSWRQVAVDQALSNACFRYLVTKSLQQPSLARYFYERSFANAERGQTATGAARMAARRANIAGENAAREADKTQARVRPPLWKFGGSDTETVKELQGRGIAAGPWADAFGLTMLDLLGDLLTTPTDHMLETMAETAQSQRSDLSEVLLSQHGAPLRALLEDRAYHGLANVADALPPRDDADWRIGAAPARPADVYLGEHQSGIAQGLGLLVRPGGETYSGGVWQAGHLHGLGTVRGPDRHASGQWEHGHLVHGVISDNGMSMRGHFVGDVPHGLGSLVSKQNDSRGFWENGTLVEGEVHTAQGARAAFVPSTEPDEEAIGQLEKPQWRGATYSGALSRGARNGFGVLCAADGTLFAGKWENDRLVGPGARVLADRIQLGIWHIEAHGSRLVVEQEEATESSEDEE